jgi:hypothetical protein
VEVGGPGNIGDRRANLMRNLLIIVFVPESETNLASGVDDIDTEGIDSIPTNIISVDTRDENLTLMVVTEQPTDHGEVRLS